MLWLMIDAPGLPWGTLPLAMPMNWLGCWHHRMIITAHHILGGGYFWEKTAAVGSFDNVPNKAWSSSCVDAEEFQEPFAFAAAVDQLVTALDYEQRIKVGYDQSLTLSSLIGSYLNIH